MSDGGAVETALAEAVRDREERDRLERRLVDDRQQLAALEQQVVERRAILGDEDRDVQKLESFSPTRIWAGLTGSRDADLDRETAEREAARYALAEVEARRDSVQRDQDGLTEQIRVLGDVEARYAAALQAKEDWLRASGNPAAATLTDLATTRGTLLAQDRELAEAHTAGQAALQHLDEAIRLLGSAESWSTWDTFGGGGLITDMIKYDRIDGATAQLRHCDAALTTFGRELADVDMTGVRGVEVDQLTRAFDVFFDNIFSDWSVRSRVQEAGQRTSEARHGVAQALAEISRRADSVRAELAELERAREELLHG